MKKRVRYIYFAFATSFIITIVISVLYLEQFSALQKSNEQLQKSYAVKNKIVSVRSSLIESEKVQLTSLVTDDRDLLKPLITLQQAILKDIDELKQLTAEDAELQQIIVTIRQVVSLRFRILYETAKAEQSSDLDLFLKNRERGEKLMTRFMLLSDRMNEIESANYDKRVNHNVSLEFVTSFYLKIILVLSILFQVFSFVIMLNAFKRRRLHQKILENKIRELNQSNLELEQIAFVASHDLQEPLRKIRTFSDKLIRQHADELDKEGQKLLEKMSIQSGRMQELLNDFINYTGIIKSNEEEGPISLQKVFDDVRADFREAIASKKVLFELDDLPVVTGYNNQLHLLFSNLLDNSLKFSTPNRQLTIQIRVLEPTEKEVGPGKKFIKVSFVDNGIGFDKEFAEKIFVLFQRLHGQTVVYPGKGLGLAICKRVMINHDGFVTASGEVEVGAIFNLYFPEIHG